MRAKTRNTRKKLKLPKLEVHLTPLGEVAYLDGNCTHCGVEREITVEKYIENTRATVLQYVGLKRKTRLVKEYLKDCAKEPEKEKDLTSWVKRNHLDHTFEESSMRIKYLTLSPHLDKKKIMAINSYLQEVHDNVPELREFVPKDFLINPNKGNNDEN